MATDSVNVVLMQLCEEAGGAPVPAEAQIDLGKEADPLMTGFVKGGFFVAQHFALGMNIEDSDAFGAPAAEKRATVKFGAWKSLSDSELLALDAERFRFPLRMDEFAVTRVYDRASPVLFQKCAASKSFATAALVKRKAVGNGAMPQAFLRFNFEGVLITHMDWQDGPVIRETFRFVFRKIEVQYRPQRFDGKLGLGPVSPAQWAYEANLVQSR